MLVAFSILPGLYLYLREILSQAWGAYWYGIHYDPSLAYFLNGLNLVSGRLPHHVDHPGTPVQIWIACAVWLGTLGSSQEEREIHALENFTDWMEAISLSHGWFTAICMFAVALIGWRALHSASLGIALQLGFLSLANLGIYSIELQAESLIVPVAILYSSTLVLGLFGEERTRSWCQFLAAFLLVGGVACKITFATTALLLPAFLLVPVSWKGIARMLAGLALGVLLFLAPAAARLVQSSEFWWRLATHKGQYGGGEPGFADWSSWSSEFWVMLNSSPALIAFAIFCPLLLTIVILKSNAAAPNRGAYVRLYLVPGFAIAVTILVHCTLVAKHPDFRYLIPGNMMAHLGLVIVMVWLIRGHGGNGREGLATVLLLLSASLLLLSLFVPLHQKIEQLKEKDQALRQIETFLASPSSSHPRVDYFGGGSIPYALAFGNSFAGGFYSERLKQLYPGYMSWNIWAAKFENLDGEWFEAGANESTSGPFFFVGTFRDHELEERLEQAKVPFSAKIVFVNQIATVAKVKFTKPDLGEVADPATRQQVE